MTMTREELIAAIVEAMEDLGFITLDDGTNDKPEDQPPEE